MDDVLFIPKFLDLMTGDWAFVPVAAATFIVAIIMDFLRHLEERR